jgi:hypothetical protein
MNENVSLMIPSSPNTAIDAIRAAFKAEITEEVIKRQEKIKLGTRERTRLEALLRQRLETLHHFITTKVNPRIQMFVDQLKDANSGDITSIRRRLGELEIALQQISTDEDEEVRVHTEAIHEKYAKKKLNLNTENAELKERLGGIVSAHDRAVARLKSRLEDRMSAFKSMTQEIHQTLVEQLWTHVTTLRDGQLLLDKLPDPTAFMALLEKIALQSNDQVLMCLLSGKVMEKTDYFCDSCNSFGSVQEVLYKDIGARRVNLKVSCSPNAEDMMLHCKVCNSAVPVTMKTSYRCPFRIRTQEMVVIEDAATAKIFESITSEMPVPEKKVESIDA